MMTVFMICVGIVLGSGLAFVLIYPLTPGFSRRRGKHRGTTGQLALQAEQRAEREAEYAQAIVRADLIANGSRADWTLTEV